MGFAWYAPRVAPSALALAVPLALSASCVAEGAPSAPGEGPAGARGASSPDAPSTAAPRGADGAPPEERDPLLTAPFEDRFDRAELGPDWRALSPAWKIQDGRLCARGARNRGVWLRRVLPEAARIEVTAIASSDDGDLKVELWGDGRSGARSTSYGDATSYLAILGGWRNSRHVLARLDEHGDDRIELLVDPRSDDPRQRAIAPGQPYHLRFERRDGRTLRWEVDGVPLFELEDDEPLRGPGHDHIGFNDWDAPVCFDDLRIEPLRHAD